jgi:hypothetical protein
MTYYDLMSEKDQALFDSLRADVTTLRGIFSDCLDQIDSDRMSAYYSQSVAAEAYDYATSDDDYATSYLASNWTLYYSAAACIDSDLAADVSDAAYDTLTLLAALLASYE